MVKYSLDCSLHSKNHTVKLLYGTKSAIIHRKLTSLLIKKPQWCHMCDIIPSVVDMGHLIHIWLSPYSLCMHWLDWGLGWPHFKPKLPFVSWLGIFTPHRGFNWRKSNISYFKWEHLRVSMTKMGSLSTIMSLAQGKGVCPAEHWQLKHLIGSLDIIVLQARAWPSSNVILRIGQSPNGDLVLPTGSLRLVT